MYTVLDTFWGLHFRLCIQTIVHFWPLNLNFSNFSCMFLNPNVFFSNLNCNCSNILDLRNLQEQVKKAFCYQKLFWPFTVWINCSSDLKSFSQSLEQFFLTVGQNNFGNKITLVNKFYFFLINVLPIRFSSLFSLSVKKICLRNLFFMKTW